MTPVLAGLGGALFSAGVAFAVVALRGNDAVPRARQRRSRPAASGWASWRWPASLAAGLVAWAATGWPVAGVGTAAGVIGLPILLSTSAEAARRIARVEAIEDWTRRLSDVLATGQGLEQALASSARSCPLAIRPQVAGLLARLDARWPLDRALRAFADDLADPAGDLVVAALVLAARRRGPGLASVLAGVAGSVAEDVASRRRIEAERAKPRTTAKAVTVITLLVLVIGSANGTYLAPYSDPLGQLVLAALAAAFVACLLWMRRLTLPAPDPRFLASGSPR